jgi:hypothetical protein
MVNNKIIAFLCCCVFFLNFAIIANNVYGYGNEYSHPDFSEFSVRVSFLGTSDFLTEMGMDGSVEHEINGMKIWDWFRKGAKLEDAGSKVDALFGRARFNNHFHDPLKDWPEAGLSDLQDGMSMVLWAQDSFKQQGALEGDWSWRKIRKSYLDALTAKTETEREVAFADTFRGLGHQMHLIQDASQPDHVRNDAHPADGLGLRLHVGFEKWVEKHRDDIKGDFLSKNSPRENSPKFPELNLNIPQANDLVPITRLVDANLYTGTVPTAGTIQGLAEYTNSNFFSDDTIFAAERFSPGDPQYFPYPKASSTNLREYVDGTIVPEKTVAPDGAEEFGVWIKKESDGDVVNHLVRPSFFSRTVLSLRGEGELFYSTFYRDEVCHQDYAQKLIPRAVGYSAALINYFFRGQMETTALEKIDIDGNVTELQVNIQNTTPNETMKDGYFTLTCRYKRQWLDQYIYGTSADLTSGELAPDASPVAFTFTFADPIPANATEKQYILVFHDGTLGVETGAVVGKVVPVTPAEIDITHPERFVYAIVDDGALLPKEFKKLRARLRDNAPEIEMTGGSVTAKAKYKLHLSHRDDLSTEPPYAEDRSYDFYSSTSLPVEVSLDNLNPTEIEFDFSANPIPFGVTDLSLEVAYKQGDTVIAFGAKDLNEPQYIGVWNSHDRFLIDLDPNGDDDIHDWRLMTESEIMDDPALVDMLDTDNRGFIDEIIDAVPVDFDVFFSAVPTSTLPETYHATFGNVPTGRYGRVAILTDQPYFYTLFHEKYTSSLPDSSAPGDYLDYEGRIVYITPGVINQSKEETYYYTPVYSFRGVPNHFTYISAGMYPEPSNLTEKIIATKEANWPAPANTAPVPAAAINP